MPDRVKKMDLDKEPSESFKQHMADIAQAIAFQRGLKGWDIPTLAKKSNLPERYIQCAEDGQISLSHKAASKMAIALDCEMVDIDPSRKGEVVEQYG